MRSLLAVASLGLLLLACGKPPSPEELATATATDVETFWQEAVATARVTNTMSTRDELFTTIEGLSRYPASSRPVIPDTSSTNEAFADFRVLTKRVFTQANVTESGGAMVTFRVTGTDLCTPLKGSFNASTDCVRDVDALKMAIRATGGSAGIELTLLVNDKIEIGTVQVAKGVKVAVVTDLANARPAADFINNTLGRKSPFVDLTFDGKGKVEVKLQKHATSDFEASVSFLTDLSGSVTDNKGFTRSGSTLARNPVFSLRIDGPNKTITSSVDIGGSEFKGLWSDFFDYRLKNPMVWVLSGFGFKASVKDGGARTISGLGLGSGANTLSYMGQTVASVTLNPTANNRVDLDFSVATNGLSAMAVRPGISAALTFSLQPLVAAGSTIDQALLNSTYSYELASGDGTTKVELTRPTTMMDAALTLTRGTLTLSSQGNGSPRVFDSPQCLAFRSGSYAGLSQFLDFWMKCEQCVAGYCGVVLPQAPACAKYLSCHTAAIGPDSSLDSSYGPMGYCWKSSQASADACTSSCSSGTDSLKTSYPSIAACQ